MSKILISTLPVWGHLYPAVSAARKLKDSGHDVVFALPYDQRDLVDQSFTCESTNCDRFVYEPTTLRLQSFSEDIRKIEANMWSVLAIWTCSQLDPLRRVVDNHHPALIISDCLHIAPLLVAREKGVPSAVLGVTPYRNLRRGSAPPKFGLGPARNSAERVLYDSFNGLINWKFERLYDRLSECLLAASPGLGSPPRIRSVFGICKDLGSAYLQCSTPRLEDDPNQLLTDGVEFIGPMNEEQLSPDSHNDPPALRTTPRDKAKRQLVVITWGTMQPSPPQEFLEVARSFVWSSRLSVIVAPTDSQRRICEFELTPERTSGCLSVTTTVTEFLPALKRADIFVSNGGFGGVKAALTLGVPVVCAGNQDDKPDVCGRVARSGAGIGLRWCTGSKKIRRAVERVLGDASFAKHAHEVGLELAQYDGSNRLLEIVNRLISAKRSAAEIRDA